MRIDINAYNSNAFGITMADLDTQSLTGQETPDQVLETIHATQGIEHVSAKVQVDHKSVLGLLLRAGFMLVDTQLEYRCDLSSCFLATACESPVIRSYRDEDVDSLAAIARTSFVIDRWHSDESLPDDLCDAYYDRWVRSCANGYAKDILVAEEDGTCVGFLTLRDDHGVGRIDLTAVQANHRGKGVYRSMVNEALRWAMECGFDGMLATTQIGNMGSRITWVKAGFVPHNSWYVLHLPL